MAHLDLVLWLATDLIPPLRSIIRDFAAHHSEWNNSCPITEHTVRGWTSSTVTARVNNDFYLGWNLSLECPSRRVGVGWNCDPKIWITNSGDLLQLLSFLNTGELVSVYDLLW